MNVDTASFKITYTIAVRLYESIWVFCLKGKLTTNGSLVAKNIDGTLQGHSFLKINFVIT